LREYPEKILKTDKYQQSGWQCPNSWWYRAYRPAVSVRGTL